MRCIAINARDGTPRDAYVYHYLFNCSRLVDVVHTYICYLQPNGGFNISYQNPHLYETFPALVAEYMQLG